MAGHISVPPSWEEYAVGDFFPETWIPARPTLILSPPDVLGFLCTLFPSSDAMSGYVARVLNVVRCPLKPDPKVLVRHVLEGDTAAVMAFLNEAARAHVANQPLHKIPVNSPRYAEVDRALQTWLARETERAADDAPLSLRDGEAKAQAFVAVLAQNVDLDVARDCWRRNHTPRDGPSAAVGGNRAVDGHAFEQDAVRALARHLGGADSTLTVYSNVAVHVTGAASDGVKAELDGVVVDATGTVRAVVEVKHNPTDVFHDASKMQLGFDNLSRAVVLMAQPAEMVKHRKTGLLGPKPLPLSVNCSRILADGKAEAVDVSAMRAWTAVAPDCTVLYVLRGSGQRPAVASFLVTLLRLWGSAEFRARGLSFLAQFDGGFVDCSTGELRDSVLAYLGGKDVFLRAFFTRQCRFFGVPIQTTDN